VGVRVVVLGMHRSGTSAAARVVNLLGVPLGDALDLMPAGAANPGGYWESASLAAINDRLLDTLGGCWLAPPAVADGEWQNPDLKRLRRTAQARFRRVHRTESWVWKDPRNCLTLPFWRPILGDRNVALLVFRDPREVALSLSARDGCSTPYGLALWERYVRSSLANAEGMPSFVLGYDELLADADGVVARLDEFLRWAGLERSGDPQLAAIRAFIDPTLHRARVAADADGLSHEQRDLAQRLAGLAGAHQCLAVGALPPESPLTGVVLNEKRGPLVEARRLRGELAQLEARTRSAEALAEARDAEIRRAGPYARTLEARIAAQETDAAELRARINALAQSLAQRDAQVGELHGLAAAQAEALGLRLAEVEALGAALAERSALAARHLNEHGKLWTEFVRLGTSAEQLGQRNQAVIEENQALIQQNEALTQGHQALTQEHQALTQHNRALSERNDGLAADNQELAQRVRELAQRLEVLAGHNDALHRLNAELGKWSGELEALAKLTIAQRVGIAARSLLPRSAPRPARRAMGTALLGLLAVIRRER
jgi:hypothetical protein